MQPICNCADSSEGLAWPAKRRALPRPTPWLLERGGGVPPDDAPYPFQHIRIEDVWPPWDALCQYAKEVIRKGSGEIWGPYVPPEFRKWTPAKVAASLTPHGCLQVALRCTEPFKDCDDDHARALHYDRGKACRCHNRSGLIEGLADALLEYENRLNIWMSDIREMPETMKQALSTLKAAAYTYEMLRERRLAPSLDIS
jgi:hypothetical protein